MPGTVRSDRRQAAWWLLALSPATAALLASVPAGLESLATRPAESSFSALWELWSLHFGAGLLVAGLCGVLVRKLPETVVLCAGLLPATGLALHQLVLERSSLHGAIGIGGMRHWAALTVLALAILWVPCLLGARFIRRAGTAGNRSRALLLSFAALAGIGGVGYRQFGPPAEPPHTRATTSLPNLLLLTIDTLRQDALAAYGGPETALDDWTRSSAVLDGWSPSPWTHPALRALLRGAAAGGSAGDPRQRIPSTDPWWPETLQRAGYRTAAFVSNPFLRTTFGFGRGFARYDHADEIERMQPAMGSVLARFWQRFLGKRGRNDTADRRTEAAQRWLSSADSGTPWFLWVHLFDPHVPYTLRGANGEAQPERLPSWTTALGAAFDGEGFSDVVGLREGRVPRDPAFIAGLSSLYASEVGFAAHYAARLLGAAREASRDRPLVWVLTSDHGEEFFEHGGFEHGHSLYQELLRVPLVVGGVDASSLPRSMRLQDIGPWFLARHGLPPLEVPQDNMPPELRPGLLGSASPPVGCAVALVAGGMLYGPAHARWIGEDGSSLLVDDDARAWRTDVCADRGDRAIEPADKRDARAGSILEALESWRTSDPGSEALALDDDLLLHLRALGYLN